MSEPSLPEFLLERIAEDEAVAESLRRAVGGDPWGWQPRSHPMRVAFASSRIEATPARVLAECEAKRRIVARIQMSQMLPVQISNHAANAILGALALPYADHPDYREEWKP